MNATVELSVYIPCSLKKSNITSYELQVLLNGKLSASCIILYRYGKVGGIVVEDDTIITLELRGIHADKTMDAPIVHEFTIVGGHPEPKSDLFGIKVLKAA